MSFKKVFSNSSRVKHPTLSVGGGGDKISYQNGSGSLFKLAYKNYLSSVVPIDNSLRIISNLASKARFSYMREDSKGKLTKAKIKQIDSLFMNDKESVADWNKLAIATLSGYESIYILPQEAKHPTRAGLIDFFILDNNKIKLEVGTNTTIGKYIYKTADGTEVTYTYDQMIYIASNIDVTNYLYSLPKLKSLNTVVQNYLASDSFYQNYVSSGGKRSAIISAKDMISPKTQDEIKTALESFLKSNEVKALFIDEGIDVNTMTDSLNSIQLLEQMTHINNTIYEHFQIPAFLRGDYSDVSSDEALRVASRLFFQTTIEPLFETLALHMTKYIRNYLGLRNIVVRLDYKGIDILEDSLEKRVASGQKLHQQGVISLNEFREMMELEPLPFDEADWNLLPQYINGSKPLSIQNYATDIANSNVSEVPSGNGGANNQEGMRGAV
jgi:HK97 family phage portal protein